MVLFVRSRRREWSAPSVFFLSLLSVDLVSFSSAFIPPAPRGHHVQVRAFGGSNNSDSSSSPPTEECSICIIGGGVSGLAAAYTCGKQIAQQEDTNIVLLEASPTLGGRVQSDRSDGYILDRGFAVFLEQYPNSKALLDYDELDLHQFDPGALVKQSGREGLSRVADPLRQPSRLFDALTSPVGTIMDKIRLVPLIIYVVATSVEVMFEEEETDTLSCLRNRWRFSEEFISEFLSPFLEGIYLAPLSQQSSRMFHFVFKMFTIGSVSLPRNGIGAVADQLVAKARRVGVDIRTDSPVETISVRDDGEFTIQIGNNGSNVRAKNVILATDVKVSQKIVSTIDGYESVMANNNEPVERSVGCLYYGFDADAPIDEPILLLNGLGDGKRGTRESPINNACFPSVVCDSYAPPGCNLCSVSILEDVMDYFDGQDDKLDRAVRKQLSDWFPSHAKAILDPNKWVLKGSYRINNAQPAQFGCSFPASANDGRDVTAFRGTKLPDGMFAAGDHMITSSLNGALGSGIKVGNAVASEFAKGTTSS